MTGEGIAAILVGIGTLATQLSSIALQFKQGKVSQANSDKLDAQGGKLDEVHAATAAIQEATGTHKALPPP
jgi:hypothetical protein